MAFRYTVRLADGDDAGEVELLQQARAGEEIRLSGNREVRALAVIPAERIAEFVDRPLYGILEVEPID